MRFYAVGSGVGDDRCDGAFGGGVGDGDGVPGGGRSSPGAREGGGGPLQSPIKSAAATTNVAASFANPKSI